MWHNLCHIGGMPTINMRQLRNTRQLECWLKAGETIELQKRNRPVARIVPVARPAPKDKVWPDFEARLKQVFGDRVLNVVDEFIEDRNRW
jgi:antitoxin (DNA-binding transcriptional repressor) of toxin-antitoxin stability system